MTGTDVEELQNFLNARGFFVTQVGPGSPGNETTYFGPATRIALAKFQAANNISPASGFFGPLTRAFISGGASGESSSSNTTATTATSAFPKDLKMGETDPEVRSLQQYLNAHGFIVAAGGAGSPGNETDYFGTATKAALIKFQKANNISPAVGYFGPLTRAAMH